MPKPVCLSCQCFFRPKRNGFMWTEGMPTGRHVEGNFGKDAEGWKPYKVWRSDLWECPLCGHQIISGHASHPSGEHYQPNFAEVLALADLRQINDC